MIFKSGKGLILGLLLVTVLLTGCSGDSEELSSGDGLIKSVNGPEFVIKNDPNPTEFSVDTDASSPTYNWIVEDPQLASFNNSDESKTILEPTTEGVAAGKVNIQVKVNDTLSDPIEVYFLSEENENTYGGDGEDQFHAIVATKDWNQKGYIAAGYKQVPDKTNKHEYEKDAYVVRADTEGVIFGDRGWTSTVDGDGDSTANEAADDRFMAIEDITKFAFKDEYFVIGYQWTTADQYEGYIMRVDRDGNLKNEYTDLRGDNVFLRSGVSDDYLVVVGNEGTQLGADGYIAKLDPEKNEGAVKKRIKVNNSSYTRLTAVEKTAADNFIITAFAGSDVNDTKAYFLKLNGNLDVSNPIVEKEIKYNTNSIKRLYNIKKTSDGNYVVVGSTANGNGFMAKLDDDGNTSFEKEYSSVAAIRDVTERHSENGYILVSDDGSVTKTDANGNQLKVVNISDDLRALTKADDGNNNYLVVGRKENDAHVAKLDDNLNKVNRIQ